MTNRTKINLKITLKGGTEVLRVMFLDEYFKEHRQEAIRGGLSLW